jgi:FkbM family methyltransferase
MRVCLVDHAYHQRTRSTSFVKQELLAAHEVDEWWDDRWHSGAAPDPAGILEHDYDLIVVLQASELVAELVHAGASNLVFIPMWDNARRLSDKYWRSLDGVRILSFCHALHERMQRLGVLSTYAKYYPDSRDAEPVGGFEDLRGFFWQRHFELTWEDIAVLVRGASFSGMHLHLAQDPNAETRNLPSDEDVAQHNLTTSDWFGTQEEYLDVLARSNVFFAPRLSEGIGFSFIEAMAMGMCVVAVDQPTMSEYITDGVSGLLWPVGRPRPLDFKHAAELGRRAREGVFIGRERWLSDLPRVLEFIETPSDRISPSIRDYTHHQARPSRDVSPQRVGEQDDGGRPLVSVVTVTLNCRDEFEDTLASVVGQHYLNLEVIVVDGGSSDGTLELIRANDQLLDAWVSEPDDGPFDAMEKAAGLANGKYLLFMNAGDRFVGPQAISHALRFAPTEADFVYGHHIYRGLDGVDQLHKANDFEITWRRLQEGHLDSGWLIGVPGHQATFVRTSLLREYGFNRSYRVAADHEFMYRMRKQGASFYNCDLVVSAYASGGFSWRNQDLCFDEWERMAAQYGNPEAARRFVDSLRQTRMQAIRSGIARRFGLAEKIVDAVSARIARRRVQRSGLFSAQWYLDEYPDVREAGLDPAAHYVRHGARELRDPSPLFSTGLYVSKHPDVARTGANPLLHYLHHRGTKRAAEGTIFTSQYGEDEFLVEHGLVPSKGVFVDVGAGDPVRFSNTYSLEQAGWTGLCVDADAEQVEALRRVRKCAVEWAAVSPTEGEVEFLHCQDPDYSTTLDHLPDLAASEGWEYTTSRVSAVRLETLLEKHNIGKIDLLSIDTEGSELDVCDTLDWDAHRPRVVVIEYLTHGRPAREEAIRLHFGQLPYRLVYRTTSNLIFAETKLPRVLARRSAIRRYFARRDAKRFPLDAADRHGHEGQR